MRATPKTILTLGASVCAESDPITEAKNKHKLNNPRKTSYPVRSVLSTAGEETETYGTKKKKHYPGHH